MQILLPPRVCTTSPFQTHNYQLTTALPTALPPVWPSTSASPETAYSSPSPRSCSPSHQSCAASSPGSASTQTPSAPAESVYPTPLQSAGSSPCGPAHAPDLPSPGRP